MMHQDPMRDALKRRKSQGLDITISIDPQGQQAEKDSDLAPKGEDMAHEMAEGEALPASAEEVLAQDEEQDEQMLAELTGDMSEHEKQMAMEPGRKPLSLGARARMEALAKQKQGK